MTDQITKEERDELRQRFWDRYYNRQVCSPAQNHCRNNHLMDEAALHLKAAEAALTAAEKQIAELREALDVREMWSNPDDFDKAADEIDCGRGCAALWVEYDTNASGCRNAERGDYCPNDVAETLREVGKLARAARKAYDGSEPKKGTDNA